MKKGFKIFAAMIVLFGFVIFPVFSQEENPVQVQQKIETKTDFFKFFFDVGAVSIFNLEKITPKPNVGKENVDRIGGLIRFGFQRNKMVFSTKAEFSPFHIYMVSELNAGYHLSSNFFVSTGIGIAGRNVNNYNADRDVYEKDFKVKLYIPINLNFRLKKFKKNFLSKANELWLEAGLRSSFSSSAYFLAIEYRFTGKD